MYQRKTRDEFVIQGYYGFGWEDECVEETRKEGLARLREYRANSGYAHRMIVRRVRIPEEELIIRRTWKH